MLTKTQYRIDEKLIRTALAQLPSEEFRYTINQPTGDFFYDPWIIKDEYKGTVWAQILDSLPLSLGEARIILLDPGKCYQSHADIDDRYHLNLQGDDAYLIDIENNVLHKLNQNCTWYKMDAGSVHSAANFGRTIRVQIVVRQLLTRAVLKDSTPVKITVSNLSQDDARFLFDVTISPWLNRMNKIEAINSFSYTKNQVTFNLEKDFLSDLKKILPENLNIE
jgi:hypothetical protein